MIIHIEGQPESFNSEEMKRVVGCLDAAGWFDKDKPIPVAVASGSVILFYSAKGDTAMRELVKLLIRYIPNFLESPHQSVKITDLNFFVEFAVIAPELVVPPLSEREYNALIGLAYGYALDDKNGFGKRSPAEP